MAVLIDFEGFFSSDSKNAVIYGHLNVISVGLNLIDVHMIDEFVIDKNCVFIYLFIYYLLIY